MPVSLLRKSTPYDPEPLSRRSAIAERRWREKQLEELLAEAAAVGALMESIGKQLQAEPERVVFCGQRYSVEYLHRASVLAPEDAARIGIDRLRTLIDEIREARQRLRASADAQPPDIVSMSASAADRRAGEMPSFGNPVESR
jgi:hypothetical protein